MAQMQRDLVLGLETERRRHRVTQVGSHWIDILANHGQLILFQIVPKQMENLEPLKEKFTIYIKI